MRYLKFFSFYLVLIASLLLSNKYLLLKEMSLFVFFNVLYVLVFFLIVKISKMSNINIFVYRLSIVGVFLIIYKPFRIDTMFTFDYIDYISQILVMFIFTLVIPRYFRSI